MGKKQTPISVEERQHRKDSVNFSRASMGLEGFKRSPEAEVLAQRFARGEIDLDEYLAPSYEKVHKLSRAP